MYVISLIVYYLLVQGTNLCAHYERLSFSCILLKLIVATVFINRTVYKVFVIEVHFVYLVVESGRLPLCGDVIAIQALIAVK